jgi:hypothetical protein
VSLQILETEIYLRRALLENVEGGSSTGDFERWMKVVLGLWRLFLKRLTAEDLEGGPLYRGPAL